MTSPATWNGVGIGLRAPHMDEILTSSPDIPWLEVLIDNFQAPHSAARSGLLRITEQFPITLHCVSLNLGGHDPLDLTHLRRLRPVIDQLRPLAFSDHLCWTRSQTVHHHDLLPVQMSPGEALRIGERIRRVQDHLGMRLTLENVSSYVRYTADVIPEAEYLALLAEYSDCHLLLDLNNVAVSAFNHQFPVDRFLDALPPSRIAQYHVAGFAEGEVLRVDHHGCSVPEATLDVWRQALKRFGPRPTLLEWDRNLPSFCRLLAEQVRLTSWQAQALDAQAQGDACPQQSFVGASSVISAKLAPTAAATTPHYQHVFSALLTAPEPRSAPPGLFAANRPQQLAAGLGVYRRNHTGALFDALRSMYRVTQLCLGEDVFAILARDFAKQYPATSGNLDDYGRDFPAWMAQHAIDHIPTALAVDLARLDYLWERLNTHIPPIAEDQLTSLLDPNCPPAILRQLAQQLLVFQLPLLHAQTWLRAVWEDLDFSTDEVADAASTTTLLFWRDAQDRRVAMVADWLHDLIKSALIDSEIVSQFGVERSTIHSTLPHQDRL